MVKNDTNEEVQIFYFFESPKECNLIALGPGNSASIKHKNVGARVTVSVVRIDGESGNRHIIATYTVQMNCLNTMENINPNPESINRYIPSYYTDKYRAETFTWMNLQIVKKCDGKYLDLRRAVDTNGDHFYLKIRRTNDFPVGHYWKHYSQVYNNTPFDIKILVSDAQNRTTTQVIEPGESSVVATKKGKNTVQIVEFEADNLLASLQEDAKELMPYLGKGWYDANRGCFPNFSTLIAQYTGNHFSLVQGVLRYSFCTKKWTPVELLDQTYDHRQEFFDFKANLEYCSKCACKHESMYKIENLRI